MGNYAAYEKLRQDLLILYTAEALMKNPNIKRIVGVASEPSEVTGDGTKTMICDEQSEWTDEKRKEGDEQVETTQSRRTTINASYICGVSKCLHKGH